MGARDAPLRVFVGIWFFLRYLWGFGRTRCAPTGFWVDLGGFRKNTSGRIAIAYNGN
ncbi:hypothetical protein BH695_2021 [Microcystis aeruginosa PCC 7806SL]|uniref:Uncharacterized protein n=1 Tax=Microcystis aeruginosa PCC 7806SL TaxID=1903187 RepID=A0AB33BXX3_MICA7|nr:hypothetical protein BH695_2021 [Microcystis aeruginosa PCC 7806SL]